MEESRLKYWFVCGVLMDHWINELFTDECRMYMYGKDGRNKVYRRARESYAACTRSPRVAFEDGSLMFWAGISFERRADFLLIDIRALTAERYRADILEEYVHAGFVDNDFLLM